MSRPTPLSYKTRNWGSVANREAGYERPAASLDLGSQLAELLERTQLGPELTFADQVHDLDPCNGCGGRRKALEAQHGSLPTLDEPMVLFNQIVQIFDPHHLDRYRTAETLQHSLDLPDALGVALLSMTIFRGRPLASIARAKNLIAAGLLRRFDSMKFKVFPNLSTAR